MQYCVKVLDTVDASIMEASHLPEIYSAERDLNRTTTNKQSARSAGADGVALPEC